jgi:hypothetical protein
MKIESLKRKNQQDNVTAKVFYLAFQNLAHIEKNKFLTILASDKKLMEDLMDISVIERRKKESSRPLREILKEMNV